MNVREMRFIVNVHNITGEVHFLVCSQLNKKNVVGMNEEFSLGGALHFSAYMCNVFISEMIGNLKSGISERFGDDDINFVFVLAILYMLWRGVVFHGLLFVSSALVLSHI